MCVFSQNTAIGTEVIWGPSATCSPKNNDEVKTVGPTCDRVDTKKGVFYIISFRGVSLAFSFLPGSSYSSALIQITNRSGSLVNFNPLESSIDVFDSETESVANPGKKQTLIAITSDEAKKRSSKEPQVTNTSATGSVTQPTRDQSGTKTYTWDKNGRLKDVSSGVPSSPAGDGESRMTVIGGKSAAALSPTSFDPALVSTSVTRPPQRIFDQAIKKQVLADQQKAAGTMFFDTVRVKDSYILFKIRTDNVTFVFPYQIKIEKRP